MSNGRQLLEELRRALAEELIPEVLRNRELRKVMLLALSREMATKEDIETLKKATKEDIEDLREATKGDIEALRKATKEDIEALREDIEALRKATKEDMEKLEAELKSYVDARVIELKSYIDTRLDSINERISDLYGIVKASLVAIVITLASTILVPLILRILF
jgi:citrate synthase